MFLKSDLDAKAGDWVMFHRLSLVEVVPAEFAGKVEKHLRGLGMDENLKFPKVAIKYLERLKQV